MNRAPAFQFYANDWLSSTNISTMTPAEEGAYIRLLCYSWNDPYCTIPDNDDELAVLSRLGKEWFNGTSEKIKKCFQPDTKRIGRIFNKRLREERKKQNEWRKKSREGGIRSGKSRGNKAQEEVKGASTTLATKDEPKVNSSVFSLQSSSSKEKRKPKTLSGTNDPRLKVFESLWAEYPLKDGRKEALKHFLVSVTTEQDVTDIGIAMQHYRAHLSANSWKKPKNGKTWFNNWRDWINWVEPMSIGGSQSKFDQVKQSIQDFVGNEA